MTLWFSFSFFSHAGVYTVPPDVGRGAERVFKGCLERSVHDRWTIAMVDEVAWGVGWGCEGDDVSRSPEYGGRNRQLPDTTAVMMDSSPTPSRSRRRRSTSRLPRSASRSTSGGRSMSRPAVNARHIHTNDHTTAAETMMASPISPISPTSLTGLSTIMLRRSVSGRSGSSSSSSSSASSILSPLSPSPPQNITALLPIETAENAAENALRSATTAQEPSSCQPHHHNQLHQSHREDETRTRARGRLLRPIRPPPRHFPSRSLSPFEVPPTPTDTIVPILSTTQSHAQHPDAHPHTDADGDAEMEIENPTNVSVIRGRKPSRRHHLAGIGIPLGNGTNVVDPDSPIRHPLLRRKDQLQQGRRQVEDPTRLEIVDEDEVGSGVDSIPSLSSSTSSQPSKTPAAVSAAVAVMSPESATEDLEMDLEGDTEFGSNSGRSRSRPGVGVGNRGRGKDGNHGNATRSGSMPPALTRSTLPWVHRKSSPAETLMTTTAVTTSTSKSTGPAAATATPAVSGSKSDPTPSSSNSLARSSPIPIAPSCKNGIRSRSLGFD